MKQPKRELKTVNIDEIKPYPNNPRQNDNAVAAVAESIKQCGYCAPIIVDEGMTILAGHTRLKTLQQLEMEQIEVCVISGLTQAQKRKYRLLDNKTGEVALWDFDKLEVELDGLDFDDFNFGFDFEVSPIDDGDIGETDHDQLYLSFGKHKVPITDDEMDALSEALDSYVDREGVSYGFGLWLANRN